LDAIYRLSQTSGLRGPQNSHTFAAGNRRIAFDLEYLSGEEVKELVLVELLPDADRPLTRAERRVLALLERGVTLRDASVALCVSLETVRTHTRGIYRKYGVSSRAELLAARRL
jgi:DNA-binding CsgD family transcriptional regulator